MILDRFLRESNFDFHNFPLPIHTDSTAGKCNNGASSSVTVRKPSGHHTVRFEFD